MTWNDNSKIGTEFKGSSLKQTKKTLTQRDVWIYLLSMN